MDNFLLGPGSKEYGAHMGAFKLKIGWLENTSCPSGDITRVKTQ